MTIFSYILSWLSTFSKAALCIDILSRVNYIMQFYFSYIFARLLSTNKLVYVSIFHPEKMLPNCFEMFTSFLYMYEY